MISTISSRWLATLAAIISVTISSRLPAEDLRFTDEEPLRLPMPGDYGLRVLSPSVLELSYISTKDPEPHPVSDWALESDGSGNAGSKPADYTVLVDGEDVGVRDVGLKRRVIYAAHDRRDLRIGNYRYLQLSRPIDGADVRTVEVKSSDGKLWNPELRFLATTDPLRINPAIHVNQVGYTPKFPKTAMIGYYLGTLGELPVAATTFSIVERRSGKAVHNGTLKPRKDVGFSYSPLPYQQLLEADFSAFNVPGDYRLQVPGLGVSLPFRIDDGSLMAFVRTYALGLYHQRCGQSNALPFTRFTHDACHVEPASIPMPASEFLATWNIIKNWNADAKPENLKSILRDEGSQLYPYERKGRVDVSGGHHDAGDYSKYTTNSAALIHALVFAVDALPGAVDFDNLGLPESGDGVSDLLQAAKWESDFLARMQDTDGGFYFLVYPRDRKYELDVLPERGDPQVVWPKNTAVTAAAVAALAQCASSPRFRRHFPTEARQYLEQARLGWKFLQAAIDRHGKAGAYQKLTHYSENWTHDDELAWAACELYLATGEQAFHDKLREWLPNPQDPAIRRWGWWRLPEGWGHAIRSYAFAVRSGRTGAERLDRGYLMRCESEVLAAGNDAARWSHDNAYGSSFPDASKRMRAVGWYFSNDQAFDITVAYQLDPRPDLAEAVMANLNFEAGCNPANISFIAGLGWKRHRVMVHQYALNDWRTLPPTGIPFGNLQTGFYYGDLYKSELGRLSYPDDGTSPSSFPLYDRWSDSFNVATEFIAVNIARSLASLAFFAARTPAAKTPPLKGRLEIVTPKTVVPVGQPIELTLRSGDLDLTSALIVWDVRDHEPALGPTFSFTPKSGGSQPVEVEVQWPDGRRLFAAGKFEAKSPVETWMDGVLPRGAAPGASSNDGWQWLRSTGSTPFPSTLVHWSSSAAGLHEHWFDNASTPFEVRTGDVLYAYVYIDPQNLPKQLMLHWNDGTWEHRAYWGEDLINYGTKQTASRRQIGPLPSAGEWIRLEVPAKVLGLEGRSVKGLGFSLFDGRAAWGPAGKLSR